jgi:hypothetical protein
MVATEIGQNGHMGNHSQVLGGSSANLTSGLRTLARHPLKNVPAILDLRSGIPEPPSRVDGLGGLNAFLAHDDFRVQ